MNETAQMNRYRRACEAAVSRLAGPHSSAGHRVAAEHDHRLLLEHSPTAGSQPVCEGCGGSWPCDLVEAAMQQVGVRLDEDEQTARAATPGPWEHFGREGLRIGDMWSELHTDHAWTAQRETPGDFDSPLVHLSFPEARGRAVDAAHIARHDPARVLRDVEAKRGVLAWVEEAMREGESADYMVRGPAQMTLVVLGPVALQLAAAYADHPDYREEWRP